MILQRQDSYLLSLCCFIASGPYRNLMLGTGISVGISFAVVLRLKEGDISPGEVKSNDSYG